ncbi:MAG: amino acid adenylation domain-containing protein [Caldilineaceae bacterium]
MTDIATPPAREALLPALSAPSNLTRNQMLIWLGQALHPNVPIYNMAHTFAIHGAIDARLFQRAFQQLVDASDAMRTVFTAPHGIPQQLVLAELDYNPELIDLSTQTDPDAALRNWLDRRVIHMLDAGRCTFDAALLKVANDRFVWYFNQHHLVTDMLSIALIFAQVSANYSALRADPEATLAPLNHFSDYLTHELDSRQVPQRQKAVEFWRAKLMPPPEPVNFYGKSVANAGVRTHRVVVPLGRVRTQQLRARAQQDGIRTLTSDLTLSSIFSAILFAYIHRISGQERLSIGVPFHNRATPAFKQTIGLFINIFPLLAEVVPGETFQTLIQKLQKEALQNLRHAHTPPDDYAQNRAYNLVLNYLTAAFGDFAGRPTDFQWVHSGYGDGNHALRLQIHDFAQSGEITLYFDLNAEIFDETARGWVTSHFLRLLDAFLQQPAQLIGAVSLLSETEHKRFLIDFNQTTASYPHPQTVVQLFEAQVARTPDATAVADGRVAWSYAELNRRADLLAHYLTTQGVGRQALVGICTERSAETLVAIWGVLKAGAAYAPLDAAYPAERLLFMLDEIDCPVLLTQQRLLAHLPNYAGSVLCLDADWEAIECSDSSNYISPQGASPDDLAYVIFTSGSTGKPKGAKIHHQGLVNYIWWARRVYCDAQPFDFPLFSSLAFDLTVTSIFTPLVTGGKVVVYGEDEGANDLAVLRVLQDDAVDIIKLTPAHLALITEMEMAPKRVTRLIVGGEDFKTALAQRAHTLFAERVAIYNEYGPTETVVGCMIHQYDPAVDTLVSVPIGRPAANARIYLLDRYLQPVPTAIVGEMYVAGDGVCRGYLNRTALTAERFLDDPFQPGHRMYKTGDLARWNRAGQLEFLGRADHQVKIRGHRIELGEIEASLLSHAQIQECAVTVMSDRPSLAAPTVNAEPEFHCSRCGLPANYPNLAFDADHVCSLCRAYAKIETAVQSYFKPMSELENLVAQIKQSATGQYDSMVLLSGGKDSTYMLYKVVELGLRPLLFTLDNGYISEGAKANIRRVAADLGLDVHFGATPHMNAIFVESLQKHCNVCNGCFKTIYTLSMKLACDLGIRHIFTGLARGQLFETRLTQELFDSSTIDIDLIDQNILDARKAYHRQDDVIARTLDVSIFQNDRIFNEIQFIDFYRYCDVELDDMLAYLAQHAPWIRPGDTGRSTNCLINDVGIHVHKRQRGYHNYALPYSWDVRLGHKQRNAALHELNDAIDVARVHQILDEIGYTSTKDEDKRIIAHYTAHGALSEQDVRAHLVTQLPVYMLPSQFIQLAQMPLTPNGKIDRAALPHADAQAAEKPFTAPEGPLEEIIAAVWAQALNRTRIGAHDNFFDLGGASLAAIQIVARLNQEFEMTLPLRILFDSPTVAQLSHAIEEMLLNEIEGLSDAEAEALIGDCRK